MIKLPSFKWFAVSSCLVTGLFGFVLLFTQPAYASLYGEGGYSSCGFSSDCPAPPPPTITTTPTGLEVSINLTNGQLIPKSGYGILITPLNGDGSSFKEADIYINGTLVESAIPEETGTVQWQWIPQALGSTTVKVIITDTNNATTEQQFTVDVVSVVAVSTKNGIASQTSPPHKTGIAGIVQSVANGTASATQDVVHAGIRIVKSLPTPVAHSFPYVLFILLSGDAVLLLYQSQRELHEYHTMQALLTQLRTLDDAKKSFADLVSHYLRTPLTVIMGGIDLLDLDKSNVHPNTKELKQVSQHVHTTVESLVALTQVADQKAIVNSMLITKQGTQVWRQRGLFVPIILVGAIWLVFEYLVHRAGTFSESQVRFAAQTIVFLLVSTMLYLVFRSRQLHRRDKVELEQIVAEETAIVEARDTLIASAVGAFEDDMALMDKLIVGLGDSKSAQSIKNGQQRFKEVVTKFAVVGQLRGTQSQKPFVGVQAKDILDTAWAYVSAKAVARNVTVMQEHDAMFTTQDPTLLEFVLASVLENAVSFSPDKGVVTFDTFESSTFTTITVTDHGSGVPPARLALLFQPFSKVDDVEVFTNEGMGFSLYLDKLIMTYLGGDISMASDPHKATVVTIHLPKEPTNEQSAIVTPTSETSLVTAV